MALTLRLVGALWIAMQVSHGALAQPAIPAPRAGSASGQHDLLTSYGAICDGTSHPLSARFSTLAAAQAVYPSATALTDETDGHAILQALAGLGPTGGSVLVPASARCVSNIDIVLPPATSLRGTLHFRGSPGAANAAQPWNTLGSSITLSTTLGMAEFAGNVMTANTPTHGAWKVGQTIAGAGLVPGTAITSFGTGLGGAGTYTLSTTPGKIASEAVNASASIRLQSGSGVDGLLVQRQGITYQETNASAFAGTGISTLNEPSDVFVTDSAIMGFAIGIISPSGDRVRLEHDYLDDQACVDLAHSYDTTRILHIQCWPFVTYAPHPGQNNPAGSDRTGKGFYLHDGMDGSVVDDILSYQHLGGGLVYGSGAGNSTASHIFIDGTARAPLPGETPYGVWFAAGSNNVQITDADIYGQTVGFLSDTGNGEISATNIRVHYSYQHSFQLASGATKGVNWYSQTTKATHGDGIVISGVTTKLMLDRFRARGTPAGSYDVLSTDPTTNISISGFDTDLPPTQQSMKFAGPFYPTIASASVLPLPQSGETFIVSGTTPIRSLANIYPGRTITLLIRDGLIIVNGSWFRLTGGTNAALRPGEVIQFISTATNLIEVSRGGG